MRINVDFSFFLVLEIFMASAYFTRFLSQSFHTIFGENIQIFEKQFLFLRIFNDSVVYLDSGDITLLHIVTVKHLIFASSKIAKLNIRKFFTRKLKLCLSLKSHLHRIPKFSQILLVLRVSITRF